MKLTKRILLGLTSLTLLASCQSPATSSPASSATQPNNQFLTGMTAPANEKGNDGDAYLDVATGDLYYKASGSWSKTVSLKGNDGAKGESGSQGQKGDKGDKGEKGEDGSAFLSGLGAPLADYGFVGDTYLDYEHFDLYVKETSGWAKKASFNIPAPAPNQPGQSGSEPSTPSQDGQDSEPSSPTQGGQDSEPSSPSQEATETITFASFFPDLEENGSAALTTISGQNVAVTFSQGSSANAPKYYFNGASARIYSGGDFAITSEKTIAKIAFTLTVDASGKAENKLDASTGSYVLASDLLSAEWNGQASEISFSVTGKQFRMSSLTVTFAA